MNSLAATIARWITVLFLSSLALPFARADQLADIKTSGKLRVAIINGLPSFSSTFPKQGFIGSDVDTAHLIAKDLGVTPEFVFVANADRIPALESRRADIIISALSITPERERQIALSVPYSSIALVIGATHQYAIGSYLDLGGKRIGVGRNTSNGMLLKQNAPTANLLEYNDESSLIDGYLKHQFDIISCQSATLREINSLLKDRPLEEKFIQTEFQVAMGMRKHERGFREWVNNWVVANLANGKLNEVFRRHHGRDLPESVLPQAARRR